MKRRSFLLGTTALALVQAVPADADTRGDGAAAVGTPNTTVTISGTGLAGDPFTYDVSTGTDLGSYRDPYGRFTMANIRCTVSGSPLVVYFRHDLPFSSGGRREILVEYPPIYSNNKTPPFGLIPHPNQYTMHAHGYQIGDILTVVGGTSVTQARFLIKSGSGDAWNLVPYFHGLYSALPPNPCNLSGGSGTGGQISYSLVAPDMPQYRAVIREGSSTLFTTLVPSVTFLNPNAGQPYSPSASNVPVLRIVDGGSGYHAGDQVRLVGGKYTAQAYLTVASVGAGGVVTGFYDPTIPQNSPNGGGPVGTYQAAPVGVVTTTGGSGSGLTLLPLWYGHQAGQRWRWQSATRSLITPPNYIRAMTLVGGGSGYKVGDTLAVNGGTSVGGVYACQITVTGVSASAIRTFTFYPGEYLIVPSSPVSTTRMTGSGSGATFNITSAAYASLIDYLAQSGRTFVFRGVATPRSVPTSVSSFTYSPLSPSALTLSEGQTGGYVEDYESTFNVCDSYYLNTGDPRGLGTYDAVTAAWTGGVFGIAEAGASMAMCYPDPTAGYGPRNFDNASLLTINTYLSPTQLFTIAGSHILENDYGAFILTGDPYYLELLQYICTYLVGGYQGGNQIMAPIVLLDSPRSAACVLRYVLQAYVASYCISGNTPGWLRPWSYWARRLENNRQYHMGYYNNSALQLQALIPSRISSQPADIDWMFPLYQGSLEAAAQAGIPGWAECADFCGAFFIISTNATSGWSRGNIIPYDNHSYVNGAIDPTTGMFVNSVTDYNMINNVLTGLTTSGAGTPQGYGGAPGPTTIANQGGGYKIADILKLEGGAAVIPAAVQVNSLGLTTRGPMTKIGNGEYKVGDILTAVGGTLSRLPGGNAVAAKFQVTSVVGRVITVTTYAQGCYSALPSNPCRVNGGHGTGGEINFSTVIAWLPSQSFSGLTISAGWHNGGAPANPAALTGGTGSGAKVNIRWIGNFGNQFSIRNLAIVDAGKGYSVLDVLTFLGGSGYTNINIQVTSVDDSGAITALAWDNCGTNYTQLPANPVTLSGGHGTGATLTAGWTMGDPAEQNLPSTWNSDYIPYFWGCLASMTARGVAGAAASLSWLSRQIGYPPNTDDYGWNINSSKVPSAPYPFPVVSPASDLPPLAITTTAGSYAVKANSLGGIPCTLVGNGGSVSSAFDGPGQFTLVFAPDGSGWFEDTHSSFGQMSFKGFSNAFGRALYLPKTYPIALALSDTSIAHNASLGATLGSVSVTMSDGSPFEGALTMLACPTVGTGNKYFAISGSSVKVNSPLPRASVVGMIIQATQGKDCMGKPYRLNQFFPIKVT